MRIIAGKFRGRTIKFPKSKLVRPTTDKNKEAIFNMLNNYINFDEKLAFQSLEEAKKYPDAKNRRYQCCRQDGRCS